MNAPRSEALLRCTKTDHSKQSAGRTAPCPAICGESRLKAQARIRVREGLASRGLVALPEVPEDQEHPVYVTRLSSPVDLLFKAFTRPGPEALQVIRGAVGGTGEVANQQDAAKQVAELIDEARAELDKMLGKTNAVE